MPKLDNERGSVFSGTGSRGQWEVLEKTAAYSPVAADAFKIIRVNSSADVDVAMGSTSFAIGDCAIIQRTGTGLVTITGTGLHVSSNDFKLFDQYDSALVTQVTSSEISISKLGKRSVWTALSSSVNVSPASPTNKQTLSSVVIPKHSMTSLSKIICKGRADTSSTDMTQDGDYILDVGGTEVFSVDAGTLSGLSGLTIAFDIELIWQSTTVLRCLGMAFVRDASSQATDTWMINADVTVSNMDSNSLTIL